MTKNKPPRWIDVFHQGTKEGDEECRFFRALARNAKWKWRSTSALATESGLSKKRTEQIILKYFKIGMIFQNPKNEDQWGYWERLPEMVPDKPKSVAQIDKMNRIEGSTKQNPSYTLASKECQDSKKSGASFEKKVVTTLFGLPLYNIEIPTYAMEKIDWTEAKYALDRWRQRTISNLIQHAPTKLTRASELKPSPKSGFETMAFGD